MTGIEAEPEGFTLLDPGTIRPAADEIDSDAALQIFEDSIGQEDTGDIKRGGHVFQWWTDGSSAVWFYEDGGLEDSEVTVKRYEVEHHVFEVPNHD
jgi:hypothetical protein